MTVPPVRGGIYDRNGEVLAETVTRQTVVADPQIITDPTAVAAALSPAARDPGRHPPGRADRALGLRLPGPPGIRMRWPPTSPSWDLNGINLVPEAQRVVPGRPARPAGRRHRGLERQRHLGHRVPVPVAPGRDAGYDRPPRSPPTASPCRAANQSTPAYPGTGLELTLDESVQYVAEQALAAEIVASHATGGTAVIMDVKTGDILAMANLRLTTDGSAGSPAPDRPPDADRAGGIAPDTSGPTLVAQSDTLPGGRRWRHRPNSAVTQVYEPGSVFKLVTFSAALADDAGHAVHAAHGAGVAAHGPVHVPRRRGARHGDADGHPDPRPVLEHRDHRGGREARRGPAPRTRSPTSASASRPASASRVSPRAWSPGAAQWTGTSIGSTPIGQDDAVTAQQVLDAYNAVANGGVFVSPRLVRATVAADGAVTAAAPVRVPPGDRPGHQRPAGRHAGSGGGHPGPGPAPPSTATPWPARRAPPRSPAPITSGYIPGAYVGTFAGFAPAQDPVLSAIVVLDHPTPIYGGAVAAPVFSTIMAYALHHFGIPTTAAATDGRLDDGRGRHRQCHRAGRSGHGRPLGGPRPPRTPPTDQPPSVRMST